MYKHFFIQHAKSINIIIKYYKKIRKRYKHIIVLQYIVLGNYLLLNF